MQRFVLPQEVEFGVQLREENKIRVARVHRLLGIMIVAHLKSKGHHELHDVEEGLQRHGRTVLDPFGIIEATCDLPKLGNSNFRIRIQHFSGKKIRQKEVWHTILARRPLITSDVT